MWSAICTCSSNSIHHYLFNMADIRWYRLPFLYIYILHVERKKTHWNTANITDRYGFVPRRYPIMILKAYITSMLELVLFRPKVICGFPATWIIFTQWVNTHPLKALRVKEKLNRAHLELKLLENFSLIEIWSIVQLIVLGCTSTS